MVKIIKQLVSAVIASTLILTLFVAPEALAEEISGWTVSYNGGAKGGVEVDTRSSYSGNSSMKIVNESPKTSNVYISVSTDVALEEGRIYYIQAKAKAKRALNFQLCINWDKRYSLTPFGGTYDWTNYEFNFVAPSSQTASFKILVEGTANVWIDDIKFIDSVTGKNLIANSDFDGGADLNSNDSGSLDGLYNSIRKSESYKEEDLVKVRGAFKYMPVYEAKDIIIDGNASDWEEYPSMSMPTLKTQYQIYKNDGLPRDVEAECKFAYDEDNFYLFIEVTDDKFVYITGEDGYWQGDSIQLTFSELNEVYGSEMGFAHNPQTNKGEIYGSGISRDQRERITLVTSQNGNKTVYEAKIPWDVKFIEKPESLLFDFLVNDNDGDGRRYCVELSPGISEGKSNALFPLLEILDSKKDWYGWVQGERSGYTENEIKFEYYLVNGGDEKSFIIENMLDNTSEEITIPAHSGIRREINHVFDTAGEHSVQVKFKNGNDEFLSSADINIERKPPDTEYAKKLQKKLEKQASELLSLINKCEEKGISTDYEKANYRIIERFAEYIGDDIEQEDLSRIYYTEYTTEELYNQSKETLEAYISGTKDSKTVPKYITSEMEIDGKNVYAQTDNGGMIEKRPVFFVGYGHFGQAKKDIPVFNEWGVNTIQNEIGPTHVMVRSGWQKQKAGAADAGADVSTEAVHSGEKSLKMFYNAMTAANQYISVTQSVNVTPGKTYVLKGYVKAQKASEIWISANNFADRNRLDGDYDWKEFEFEYTAPAGKNNTLIRILNESFTGAIYFDDLTFCEKGSSYNLLKDGGFENFNEWEFNEDSQRLKEYLQMLEDAEENNIAVSVLISPHYFPTEVINDYNIGTVGGGFFKYNVNAPVAKKLLENFIRNLIPLIKDYKSVNNICISNEPQFQAYACGDYYLNDWHEYLKKTYNNDLSELNKAYGGEYTNFDEIDLNIDMNNLAKLYDYKIFNDKVFAQWHKWMADIIHELAPDIPLHTKVMGYVTDDGNSINFSNNGTGYQEYYEFLELNGCDYWNYVDNQKLPLVKEMWYDYMCSLRDAPVINSEDHIIPDRNQNFSAEVGDYVAQDIYQGAIHGRYMSDIWVWERTYDHKSDFWGSILFRPDAIAKISKANLDLNRLSYEITALQNEIPEVGILYSEPSVLFNQSTMQAAYQSYAAAVFNGKRAKFITEKQLWKMNDCKLLIVPNTTNVTAETLAAMKEYINNGGYVLILGEKSLIKNEHDESNDKELLDFIYEHSDVVKYSGASSRMISPTAEEWHKKVRDVLKKIGIYYVSVVDADTNEEVDNVEYNVGVYNGDLLVNLVNFDDDRNVKIYIGGKQENSFEDILNCTTNDGDIELKKYIPVTLKAKRKNAFLDTYGHWAEEDIKKLAANGVISGVSPSRFEPGRNITRAEFLALLLRTDKYEEAEYKNNIPDISGNEWYAKTAAAALKEGIIAENVLFRPNEKITREEMCGLLIKCYEAKHGKVESRGNVKFTDADEIEDTDTVLKAVSLDLMYGRDSGNFAPNDLSTRAEAAAVISRYN